MAQAGCHKPLRREQARGPQHQVKPAASTNLQSGSRAAHVTAKAKSVARNSEEAGATGSGVVMRAVTNNAAGAKGPCGGEASEAGTHEGMTGKTGSNLPDGRVRHLQRRLWVAAKRSPDRRFHALMHRIWRGDVLRKPWSRVKRNRGSAGVDRETLVEIEQYGVERMLQELGDVLRRGAYRPQPVLRRYIPKADGRKRPLGIPTVRDRVVQIATMLVLEPIFEADFRASRYAYFARGRADRRQGMGRLRWRRRVS